MHPFVSVNVFSCASASALMTCNNLVSRLNNDGIALCPSWREWGSYVMSWGWRQRGYKTEPSYPPPTMSSSVPRMSRANPCARAEVRRRIRSLSPPAASLLDNIPNAPIHQALDCKDPGPAKKAVLIPGSRILGCGGRLSKVPILFICRESTVLCVRGA